MPLIIVVALVLAAAGTAASYYLGPLSPALTFALLAAVALVSSVAAAKLSTQKASGGGEKPVRPTQKQPIPDTGGRRSGSIKWFNVSKGFGFITTDDGEDIFVHFKSIQGSNRRDVRQGASVTVTVGESAKGPQAENVQISGA